MVHSPVHVLDVLFNGPETIACYALRTREGIVLVDPGPHSTFPNLVQALKTQLNATPNEVALVLLTHIHLDHAGAAWCLAETGAQVYVHPLGYPHLLDPTKLLQSATRIYGDAMDALWGTLKPIAPDRLVQCPDRLELQLGDEHFTAYHTPGHAVHHIAWEWNGHLFCGDVGGVRIPGGTVVPPCPPPDINLEDWDAALETIRQVGPQVLLPTHFGPYTDVEPHLQQLQERLHGWAQWVKERLEAGQQPADMTDGFNALVSRQLAADGCTEAHIHKYQSANPAFMSVWGLSRYWQKRGEK